ncbi:hypothetical protein PALA111701_04270 [Paenibacillus lactis]|uniref:IS3 family transposase n=2 Tax=Paenibacillus TaxID=44249 RepID=UPI0036522C53
MIMETPGIKSEIGFGRYRANGAEYMAYYNERCLQNKLGDLSPVEFREQIALTFFAVHFDGTPSFVLARDVFFHADRKCRENLLFVIGFQSWFA